MGAGLRCLWDQRDVAERWFTELAATHRDTSV